MKKHLLALVLVILLPVMSHAAYLTGMNPNNYTLPSGWSLVRAQGFETTCGSGEWCGRWNGAIASTDGTVSPHSGSKYLAGTYANDQADFGWSLQGTQIGTYTEIYVSFYEYIGSGALFNDEFYLGRFSNESPFQEIVLDWFWAKTLAGEKTFNGPNATLYVIPQGTTTSILGGKYDTVPKGQWVQWEIWFRPNTLPNVADGFMRIYKDGSLYTSVENKNLNGSRSMNSCYLTVGGLYTKLVWMTDYPTCSVPSGCSPAPGTGTDMCRDLYPSFVGQSFSSPLCGSSLPSFKRYFDDIIVMKLTSGGGGGTDISPPYTSSKSPSANATGVAVGTTSTSVHVKDDRTDDGGTTQSTISMSVEGSAKTCSTGLTCTGTAADYTVTYSGLSLSYDQQVDITVTATDAAGNVLNESWKWYVEPDPGVSTYTDAFDRTDENPLSNGGMWAKPSFDSYPLKVLGNEAVRGGSGSSSSYLTYTVSDNQYIQGQVTNVDESYDQTLMVRTQVSAGTESYYGLSMSSDGVTHDQQMKKKIGGVTTNLGVAGTDNVLASDVWKLRVYDNTVCYDKNTVEQSCAATGGDYLSGSPALRVVVWGNGAWDNVEAGSIVAGGGGNPPPEIITTTLTGATVGTAYSATLTATSGTSPYTWTVVAGSLPSGLSLSTAGLISGTPSASGLSSFTVQAQDAAANTDNQALTITVAAATPGGKGAVTLSDVIDTYINSGAVDTSYSSGTENRIYTWPGYTRSNVTLLRVDISSIPAGSQVTYADLNLTLTGFDGDGGTSPATVVVERITGTVPDIATVTWSGYAGTNTQYDASVDVGLGLGAYLFDITNAVQNAVSEAATYLYLAVSTENGVADTNRIFASMDHGTSSFRPYVTVSYTAGQGGVIPPPSSHSPGKTRNPSGRGKFKTWK